MVMARLRGLLNKFRAYKLDDMKVFDDLRTIGRNLMQAGLLVILIPVGGSELYGLLTILVGGYLWFMGVRER